MNGDPTLGLPITVGADQTWAIDGGNQGGFYGIAVPQISGSHTLNLSFTNEGSFPPRRSPTHRSSRTATAR